MNFLTTQASWYGLCPKQVAKLFSFNALLLSALVLFAQPTLAKESKSIEQILALKQIPAGVVIEIVTGDGSNLEWALPRSKQYIKKLREAFPELPVAIVTHGAEQFALTHDEKDENKEVHNLVQSLGDANVPVHVCETFAGWRGLSAEDFPEYVNVAAAGPAQVNDYISLGYELILIDEE